MNNYLQTWSKRPKVDDNASDATYQAKGILGNVRLIGGVALLVALLGTLYALTVPPIYQANMLIQIKQRMPMSGDPRIEIPAATEVEILRSRSILSRVVQALQLDVSVEPKRFPLAGPYLARNSHQLSAPGLFGAGGYAWGAERAELARLDMPKRLMGETFVLTATGKDRFTLVLKDLGISFAGQVGVPARLRSAYGEIGVLVAAMHARPGAQFLVSRAPGFLAVDRLQRSLHISENGKQSNVIGLSLQGSNPELISRILNQIGDEYMRQHASQQSNEASNALASYDRQLAETQFKLQKLDARFARVLGTHGASDLAEESRIVSQQSVALQDKLAAAEQNRVELSSRYLSQHPSMIVADEHIRTLRQELAAIQSKRRSLAAAGQEIEAVTRDKQINAEINAGLFNVRQKLDVLHSSARADVRLVDHAETPIRPVTLGLPTMIALACLAGLVLGLVASVLKNAISGARDRPATLRYDGHFRLV